MNTTNPDFTEIIARHREVALTELEACNRERKQLDQRRDALGSRFVAVEARLRLLKEMEADLKGEPTESPATALKTLVRDEGVPNGWRVKEAPRIPLATGATTPLHCQSAVSSALSSAAHVLATHSPVQQALANAHRVLASRPSAVDTALRNAALMLGERPPIFGAALDASRCAQ